MDEYIDDLIEKARRSVELDGTLGALESMSVPEGGSLHDSLYVLKYTEGSVCLACWNPDARFFYRWVDGELREIDARERENLASRPQPADPARTAAALETAERIELVPVEATPFANS